MRCSVCESSSTSTLGEAVRGLLRPPKDDSPPVESSLGRGELVALLCAHGFAPQGGQFVRGDDAMPVPSGNPEPRYVRAYLEDLARLEDLAPVEVLAHALALAEQNRAAQKLPFGTSHEGARDCVFAAVTAWCNVYADYDDPGMSAPTRATYYPVALLVQRWDARVGFPGGFRESDSDSLVDTALRELREEVALDLGPEGLQPLVTHAYGNRMLHLFHAPLGVMSRPELADLLARASRAPHAVAEGAPFWAQLWTWKDRAGWPRLLDSNVLAPRVRQELLCVRASLLANPPTGAMVRAARARAGGPDGPFFVASGDD